MYDPSLHSRKRNSPNGFVCDPCTQCTPLVGTAVRVACSCITRRSGLIGSRRDRTDAPADQMELRAVRRRLVVRFPEKLLHRNPLQRSATRCSAAQQIAAQRNVLQRSATASALRRSATLALRTARCDALHRWLSPARRRLCSGGSKCTRRDFRRRRASQRTAWICARLQRILMQHVLMPCVALALELAALLMSVFM